MTLLATMQRLAFLLGAGGILAGFLASIGHLLLAPLSPVAMTLWLGLLGLVAVACGVCSALQLRSIERRRWQTVADSSLTSGERQIAHREAEGERRWALLSFLLTPLGFGYWLGGQPTERSTLAWAPAAGLVVYLLSWWLTARRVESSTAPPAGGENGA